MKTNLHDYNDTGGRPCHEAAPAQEIRRQLLGRLPSVLQYLLPNGIVCNHVFQVGDIDGTKGESLKVEMQGHKAGMWQDFATNEGGDIFDLWAKKKNFHVKSDFLKLMEDVQNWLGLYTPTQIINSTAPIKRSSANDDFGSPTAKWDYIDKDGKTIATVFRYDPKRKSKQFRPYDAINKIYKAPDPRPLYNLPGISSSELVVLVEGEKCAQALIDKGIFATTAMFGAKAPLDKTDWSPLKGKDVIIWPDNDEVGKNYAQSAHQFLADMGVASVNIIEIPTDKPEKWDAADAIIEGIDPQNFIEKSNKADPLTEDLFPSFGGEELWDDLSPSPDDIISPSILPPESLLVFGGAPKVGKTDFLMTWMVHMAAGIPFMDMAPARPLKIFYLQAELSYHSFKNRLQRVVIDSSHKLVAKKNIAMTSKINAQLNEKGVNSAYKTICRHFKNDVDIIVIDPLRNFFDGGANNASENDNVSMMLFLQKRIETLRNKLNPKAGIILVHHTRKITKDYLEEETFQALSGASALRGYYTTGMLLYRPDENAKQRKLIFELREGEEIAPKLIERTNGGWKDLEPNLMRVTNQALGSKHDYERNRRQDRILKQIEKQALLGKTFTMHQFCEKFENKQGLGSSHSIRERLEILATKGYIKFLKKHADLYGLRNPAGSKYGYLCVEGMRLKTEEGEFNVYPTHYKCDGNGDVLEVENPREWIYPDKD